MSGGELCYAALLFTQDKQQSREKYEEERQGEEKNRRGIRSYEKVKVTSL